ncbi:MULTISPECIES: DUF4290 domain-containing protein [Sphingobacterium]|uniref:DUF4290 domain-containing protein n=1 Tax=Sphingobacterium cellulitidis TaxID=1768011 RepID=A0A8H9G1S1_9SPHI|nr:MULTISPECIES: DUF4290 domain-containing protein [Sphingobacterium]MBA8988588.1 hypothetical protein [Sphingobacterium soli]OYD43215.1 hypothetical protein CHT99_05195 [Sphingobacterium cellulitidis]WFB62608.1 DUF4290 domain-containing protein [Sphingobacterium sp. WM]GGE34019.1 hypothetical protein GCM10011516_34570 [Sphingobacterium soli]
MIFDYNSTRPKLILAEYGRNVQNMVDYICTLSDREERNRLAQVVIDMMGVLNPHLRDVSDFKHKLWDHLYIISDFKIDVDSPYPIPTKENIHHKPETLKYPNHNIKFKHYGHTVEEMIKKTLNISNPEARQKMTLSVANFMKMAYLTWNKDSVSDDQILQDLSTLSHGELQLPADTVLTKLDFKTPPPGNRVKTSGSNTGQQQQNKPQNNYNNKRNSNNNNNNKRPSNNNNNNRQKKNYK